MESQASRTNDAATVLARMKEDRPDLFLRAEVVGRWVWIEFATRPDDGTRAYLKTEGFRWNHTRGCWQHCGGIYRHQMRGNPRWVYGSVPAGLLDSVQSAEEVA